MRRRDLKRIVTSPKLLLHTIRAWGYEITHPGDPWWSPRAIKLLDQLLEPRMTGLEWGSGRSTLWLAKRLRHLTSIEHVPAWHAKVAAMLETARVANTDLRLFELPEDTDAFGANYWEELPYAMAASDFDDASLDLIVVDGAYRMSCAWRALPKLAPGGLLVIDDALHLGSLDAWRIPEDFELVHGPGPGVWSTVIWRKPMERGPRS